MTRRRFCRGHVQIMLLLLGLVVAAAACGRAAADCRVVLSQALAQYTSPTGYSRSNVDGDWPSTQGPYKMLAPDGSAKASDGALYGYFPKGKILGHSTGFTWYSNLDAPLNEATMQYDIWFDAGFDWKLGGKLPGMCGYDCPVGCSAVNRERGWSTRLMWRKNGGMVTYAYYPDKPRAIRCGEDWWWDNDAESGRWHTIRLYNKMNTPGQPDGVSRAWLDGKLVLDKTDVPFRYQDDPKYGISRIYLTTYAGGSDVARFAPDHDQYIKFRNFLVWEGACDSPDGSQGPSGSSEPSGSPEPSGSGGSGTQEQSAAGPSGPKYTIRNTFAGGFCADLLPACDGGRFRAVPDSLAGVKTWGLDDNGYGQGAAGFCKDLGGGLEPSAGAAATAVRWTVTC